MPRPSQLLKVPRSLSSMDTAKQTLTAGSPGSAMVVSSPVDD